MTNENRSADQIERDIENERAQLSGSINDLQKKFSVETIVQDIGDMFRGRNGEIGGEIGRSITQTIARNPAATALTAVGLAWMLFGSSSSDTRHETRRSRPQMQRSRRSWQEDDAWFQANRGTDAPYDGMQDQLQPDDDRFWYGDDYGPSTADRASGMAASVRGTAESVVGTVKDVAGDLKERALDLKDRAVDLKDRLMHGTEDLSAEAQTRIRAARQKAHDARVAAQDTLNRGGRAAAGLFEDQPLVVGAIAIAVGAAIGGALPRSRMEDEALGESSDRLFAEAQSVFQEEKRKAMAVVGAARDQARGAVQDIGAELTDMLPEGKSAGQAIADRLSDAGNRVVDSAREEAERQGMTRTL